MKQIALKTIAITLVMALCGSFSGCINDNTVQKAVENIVIGKKQTKYNTVKKITVTSDYEEIKLSYGYKSLQDKNQKKLYIAMESAVDSVSDELKDGFYLIKEIELEDISLSESSIRVTLEAFNCDHPEIFWTANSFGYYSDDDVTIVQLYSEYSSTSINSMQQQLNTAVESFVNEIPLGLPEYDREKFIHDKLLQSCTYNEDADSSNGRETVFTIYGALAENSAVCEGYTKAMQYLLKLVGIESITVNGYSKNELHQWNMVNIDDSWYHLDSTWDDQDKDENQTTGIIYSYFNLTDEEIKTDHEIADDYTKLTEERLCGTPHKDADLFNLPLPVCTSEIANFFNNDGVIFTSFDDYDCYNNIVNKLYNAALNKEAGFSIRFSDELDFNDTMDKMFYSYPYVFFDYTADVNDMLDTDYKINDNLSILTYDDLGVVHVNLSYT
ncbi:MAG: transglutaminase domain-containing protein [Acutalibacteraceae bacterium]|nr:transglutaminase domain-containing protein [Acutalibacteraceae bacterium]